MGISKRHKRKALWIVFLLAVLLVSGCTGIKPYEHRDHREEGPEKGLYTGSEGEFVIFRKADAPEADSAGSVKPEGSIEDEEKKTKIKSDE
jgi:hypothetical protein